MKNHIRLASFAACFFLQACIFPTTGDTNGASSAVPTQKSSAKMAAVEKKTGVNFLYFDEIEIVGGFTTMTDFKFLPHSNEFLALGREGKVGHFRIVGKKAVPLGDFDIPGVSIGADCGAISLVLDPDFDINQLFYVGYCLDLKTSTVSRFKFNGESYASIPFSKAEIITMGDQSATRAIHAVGGMVFDVNKNLLVMFGDKGIPKNAQDPSNNLGKLLRIIPNRDPAGSGYIPAPGNPFAGDPSKSPDVYAIGFRNAWRIAMDRFDHIWAADVGSVRYEELNLISNSGENFGWGKAEGPCNDESCRDTRDPIRYYDRSADHPFIAEDPEPSLETKFRLIWVGKEYYSENDRYEGRLSRKVFYGDWCMGWIRAIEIGGKGDIISDEQVGHLEMPVNWEIGPDGYLYAAAMFSDPSIYCFDTHGDAEDTYGMHSQDFSPEGMQSKLWRAVMLTE